MRKNTILPACQKFTQEKFTTEWIFQKIHPQNSSLLSRPPDGKFTALSRKFITDVFRARGGAVGCLGVLLGCALTAWWVSAGLGSSLCRAGAARLIK